MTNRVPTIPYDPGPSFVAVSLGGRDGANVRKELDRLQLAVMNQRLALVKERDAANHAGNVHEFVALETREEARKQLQAFDRLERAHEGEVDYARRNQLSVELAIASDTMHQLGTKAGLHDRQAAQARMAAAALTAKLGPLPRSTRRERRRLAGREGILAARAAKSAARQTVLEHEQARRAA